MRTYRSSSNFTPPVTLLSTCHHSTKPYCMVLSFKSWVRDTLEFAEVTAAVSMGISSFRATLKLLASVKGANRGQDPLSQFSFLQSWSHGSHTLVHMHTKVSALCVPSSATPHYITILGGAEPCGGFAQFQSKILKVMVWKMAHLLRLAVLECGMLLRDILNLLWVLVLAVKNFQNPLS